MANARKSVPILSAFFDGSGSPDGPAIVKKLGGLTRTWALFFSQETGWISAGTHAQRTDPTARGYVGAAGVPDGAMFVETDRNNLVYQAQSGVWVYVSGTVQQAQIQLASLAATLGTNDAGLLVDVTDYAHVLRWNGAGWAFNDPSDPPGRIAAFLVDPNPAAGWHLCDGTTGVPYLMPNGKTGTQDLPDLVGSAAYLKLGDPVSGINAAVAPGFSGTPVTPTGTVGGIVATLTAGVNVTSAGVTSVAAETHTHPAPSVSINPITPGGTVDDTGEPQNIVLRAWFRQ